jgi:hypothetical protein
MKIINIALVCCFAVCACDKQSSVDVVDASSDVVSNDVEVVLSSSQPVLDAGVQDVVVSDVVVKK